MSNVAGQGPILSVRNLVVEFATRSGTIRAVDDISFDVPRGGCVGIVGESGSGKSVTALAVMRLLAEPNGRIASGSVLLDGVDIARLSQAEMQRRRGRELAMVFQEPMTSLNPVFPVGDQIAEAIQLHMNLGRRASRRQAVDALALVGIPDPERRADNYPHELSGGMRQRVMIAMALACEPKLLIADEPTTALDVTIQAQILDLLRNLRGRLSTAIVMITHDLGVVAEIADEVLVMYAGRIVEQREVNAIFAQPAHPYTEGLLRSIPRLDDPRDRLEQIPGAVPNPLERPTGCRFNPRCDQVRDICRTREPASFSTSDGGATMCWRQIGFVAPAEGVR
ncbi:MAG: ABC transporter ATP-binding protein [Alphaproteobacteria bacterium]|nr:ABC transporter ATP-binding protein [Alphaproteobacteria bacterium]